LVFLSIEAQRNNARTMWTSSSKAMFLNKDRSSHTACQAHRAQCP
jgi:hypothetical protein